MTALDYDHVEVQPEGGAEPWPDEEPIPLTQTVTVPPFPVDQFPAAIADMVAAVSVATQTDSAMPAACALSALSACTGGHAEIEIRPGWREPLNLYNSTVARPGERKSAVQSVMARPLFDVEELLAEAGKALRLEEITRKEVAEGEAAKAKQEASRAEGDARKDAMANAIGKAQAAEDIKIPVIPRIIADDVTPEAAASLLAEQGGRLAIISAEGGIFDIIGGRYSGNVPNLDLWLKGHSGDPLKIDRKNRDPEYVRHPALTLGLMIQPEVLNNIASNRQFRGRGLLARFLYAYPQSMVGHRKIAPATVPDDVKDSYNDTVKELASGLSGWLGDPALLMLTSAAHKAITAIEAAVEPTLAGDGELAHLADWGAKYVGAIARIAGILHLTEHGSEKGPKMAINEQTITAAYRIGEYFKACAIRAFTEMGTDHVTADAIYLLDRINSLGVDELSERDMHVATQSRFKKKSDMLPALDRLVEHGYLVAVAVLESTGGRPASPRYKVHAHATKGTEHTKG